MVWDSSIVVKWSDRKHKRAIDILGIRSRKQNPLLRRFSKRISPPSCSQPWREAVVGLLAGIGQLPQTPQDYAHHFWGPFLKRGPQVIEFFPLRTSTISYRGFSIKSTQTKSFFNCTARLIRIAMFEIGTSERSPYGFRGCRRLFPSNIRLYLLLEGWNPWPLRMKIGGRTSIPLPVLFDAQDIPGAHQSSQRVHSS